MKRILSSLLLIVLFLGWTSATPAPAVARIWRGRVPAARADEYAKYLGDGIRQIEKVKGNLGVQMFRGTGNPVEFTVISYWPDREAIHAFAGADIEKVHELPRDHEFLIEPGTVRQMDIVSDTRH